MLKDVGGFDILVNGTTVRGFRDREDMAIDAARHLAGSKGNGPVRVRNRATITVTADGSKNLAGQKPV